MGGSKHLCSIHHRMWKEDKLDLSMYGVEPHSVINKSQCTEREYLINILTKININAIQFGNRRSLRNSNKNMKIEKVWDFSSESDSGSQSDCSSKSWNVSCSQYTSSEYESSEYDSSDFEEPKKPKIIKSENTNSSAMD